ncbi:hypothetical protein DV736_g1971, partial [Chaetothyriales sp. CBS 134916]
MATPSLPDSHDFWLFGYGSLIWKPPPHFEVPSTWPNLLTRIEASEDHRGTPEAPGRVVTLIERSFWETLDDPQRDTEGTKVWGVAYHIVPERVAEVKEYLDIREINGYSIQYATFRPADDNIPDICCLVYIGMPDNPQFLGALHPQDVAAKINESIGPSGENSEYLLQLEAGLKSLSPESGDEHISDLARRVRTMATPARSSRQRRASAAGLQRVSSTQEQEEIEKEV